MEQMRDQPRERANRTSVPREAAVGLVRVVIVGAWGMLALLVVLFWISDWCESVREFAAVRVGSRPADAALPVAEARESLIGTLIVVVVQAVVIAGIVVAVPRLRASHVLHRLAVPSESLTRRRVYSAAMFAAAGLIGAQVFAEPGAPVRPGGIGTEAAARHLAEIRALLAGCLEEPFFSMLPVLGLALLPIRWTRGLRGRGALIVAVVVSACGRAALHLYQGGWPAAAALLWGAAAVYAYYRYRSIMGLIGAHTLWNLVAVTQYGGSHIAQVVAIGFAVLIAGFGVEVTWPRMRTAPADAQPPVGL
ncbi:type II CAAX prenyl endopeptidase Rce1 family protein [Nocardia sp. NPDC052566]|uniref:CPBP family glutamic-type intramembrane protease n=1 Tax=Nocardia sp. NPDC052566 TaxID=3364330 RepID=UPI0037CB3B71